MELSVFNQRLEKLQKVMIRNSNDKNEIYGDGTKPVDNNQLPITHEFSDQLYMRRMDMKEDSFLISMYHHTDHLWFLLKGKITVTTNGETVEHIAPCYEKSIKGAKRLIACLEDAIFVNVHKNPSNTQILDEIENNLYSFTIEEYNEKENKNKQ